VSWAWTASPPRAHEPAPGGAPKNFCPEVSRLRGVVGIGVCRRALELKSRYPKSPTTTRPQRTQQQRSPRAPPGHRCPSHSTSHTSRSPEVCSAAAKSCAPNTSTDPNRVATGCTGSYTAHSSAGALRRTQLHPQQHRRGAGGPAPTHHVGVVCQVLEVRAAYDGELIPTWPMGVWCWTG
jgi:hypothetical protein